MSELSSGQRAEKFRDDATRLRKKLELAIQETRVDDWAAERMIYVMDYLDTTLQGFFAFQDVLWNRFGDNGNALALQVGEILDRRLQYVQQENRKHLDASVGKLDDWIEEKKGLKDEIQDALKGLPELWAKTQMSDELEKVLPDVLERLKNTLKDHPENLDTLLPLWNGFLNDAFQAWFPNASKRGLKSNGTETYAKAIRPALSAALVAANDSRCHAWKKSERDHTNLKKHDHQFDFLHIIFTRLNRIVLGVRFRSIGLQTPTL